MKKKKSVRDKKITVRKDAIQMLKGKFKGSGMLEALLKDRREEREIF